VDYRVSICKGKGYSAGLSRVESPLQRALVTRWGSEVGMLGRQTLRFVCYIALALTATVTHECRAQEFLACNSSLPSFRANEASRRTTLLKEIFSRLTEVEVFSLHSETARLSIEQSRTPNAFVRGSGEVVVTTQLLEAVRNPSELAFVVAHELSHLALRHTRPGDSESELQADRLALNLVRRAGFDPCAALTVLIRLGTPYASSLQSLAPRTVALERDHGSQCAGIPLITPYKSDLLRSLNFLGEIHPTRARRQRPEISQVRVFCRELYQSLKSKVLNPSSSRI
jgi:Zn-dependent protease with chaperone function